MKLKKFLENINRIVEENPEYLNLDVVYAKDDEGNGFEIVHFDAGVGLHEDGEFSPIENFKEEGLDENSVNAICIN